MIQSENFIVVFLQGLLQQPLSRRGYDGGVAPDCKSGTSETHEVRILTAGQNINYADIDIIRYPLFF